MDSKTVAIAVLAATVWLAPAEAAAQTTPAGTSPDPSAAVIGSLVSAGDRVAITTADGVIRQGRVLSMTTAAIELQLAETKQHAAIPFERVRRVDAWHRDPVTDGLKLGAVAGVATGVVIGVIGVTAECHDRDPHESCTAAEVLTSLGVATGLGAAAGAALGTAVDALHLSVGEVWRAPGSAAVVWSPILAPRRAGLRFTVRW